MMRLMGYRSILCAEIRDESGATYSKRWLQERGLSKPTNAGRKWRSRCISRVPPVARPFPDVPRHQFRVFPSKWIGKKNPRQVFVGCVLAFEPGLCWRSFNGMITDVDGAVAAST
ncbi:hypothetical protein NL676_006492 [Syzygium grande]|nr:hypothetical protein NL676_006492 [Syzygium grande]